jgi:hypothetical protein
MKHDIFGCIGPYTCPEGQYKDITTRNCVPCPNLCRFCRKPLDTLICDVCDTGVFSIAITQGFQCVLICGDGYYVVNQGAINLCVPCQVSNCEYFFFDFNYFFFSFLTKKKKVF